MASTGAERQRRRMAKLREQARAGADAAAEASAVAELRATLAERDKTLAGLTAAIAARGDALALAADALRTVDAIKDEGSRARSIRLAARALDAIDRAATTLAPN